MIQINAGKFIPVDEVREITDEYDKNASILHGGTEKDELIIKSTLDLSNDVITDIINKFIEKYDINKNNFQSEKFGPFMGAEIKNKALLSTLIATVLMLGYITWRFEFNFWCSSYCSISS